MTVLEGAERQVDFKHGQARCSECNHEFHIKHLFDACPKCESYFKEILQGKELKVNALEVV
jgi:hydrogenase nickel incorporation protein HypA/HybF